MSPTSKPLLAAIGGALVLSACAMSNRNRYEPEFVGRTIRVEAANGQVTDLRFRRDGTVRARFGETQTQGRWELERRRLCFTWAGSFRECWPYRRPFQRGRTVSITSSRGNKIQATLR